MRVSGRLCIQGSAALNGGEESHSDFFRVNGSKAGAVFSSFLCLVSNRALGNSLLNSYL